MILKKKIMPVIIASIPMFTSIANGSDNSNLSLDSLRQNCLELRQSDQTAPFNIKIECRGSYTFWDIETQQMSLPSASTLHTQTSTKCGRFETNESMFERETCDQDINCNVLIKKELTSPEEVGIPVRVDSCDELNTENIQDICKEKVIEYCQDNQNTSLQDQDQQQNQQQQNQGSEGLCTMTVKEKINTCDSYL